MGSRIRTLAGARARVVVLAVGLGLAATSLAACESGPGTAAAATSGSAATASATSGTSAPEDSKTTPATVAPPLPQPVTSVPKVKRSGQPSTPLVSAPVARFNAPVKYPDGVQLVITKAERGIETGHGPGVMAGREYVRFTVTLTNRSTKAVNLNEVVVTTFYSASKQLAAPVYTESAGTYDFSGTVKPGASATARYGFAVPVKDLGSVTMVVDFDGLHTSATYSGAVVAS